MINSANQKPDDDSAFNETLKRMLKTPPEPHGGKKKPKGRDKTKDNKPAN